MVVCAPPPSVAVGGAEQSACSGPCVCVCVCVFASARQLVTMLLEYAAPRTRL